MGEIKTCEQYVLSRLSELETINSHNEGVIRLLKDEVKSLTETLDKVKAMVDYKVGADGENARFEISAWREYDTEEFEFLEKLMGVSYEEMEKKEETEDTTTADADKED